MHKNSFQSLLIRVAMALAATVAAVSSAQASRAIWFDPGQTPFNPILPGSVVNGTFQFSFMPRPGMTFIDPLVAVGYDYALSDRRKRHTINLSLTT